MMIEYTLLGANVWRLIENCGNISLAAVPPRTLRRKSISTDDKPSKHT